MGLGIQVHFLNQKRFSIPGYLDIYFFNSCYIQKFNNINIDQIDSTMVLLFETLVKRDIDQFSRTSKVIKSIMTSKYHQMKLLITIMHRYLHTYNCNVNSIILMLSFNNIYASYILVLLIRLEGLGINNVNYCKNVLLGMYVLIFNDPKIRKWPNKRNDHEIILVKKRTKEGVSQLSQYWLSLTWEFVTLIYVVTFIIL